MAIRLLSVLTLLAGLAVSVLYYVMLPMARAVGCSVESCPQPGLIERLMLSALPLAVAVAFVVIAWLINKRNQILARLVLAVPLAIGITWVTALFAAAMMGK